MKAVILAGGLGTRISEETHLKPKPMIEIGGKPILWHIFKIFSFYGINEFIVCCGYKGYVIKEYFDNYFLHMSDVTFDMENNSVSVHHKKVEPWKVTLVDTGEFTQTGGRLKRVEKYLNDESFCFTYGDGVSNIDIGKLITQHKSLKRLATVTAVQPPGRYGAFQFGEDYSVAGFKEKPKGDGGWINGGFFVLEPDVINYIDSDETIWEQEPMMNLAKNKELTYYKHLDFWHPMDTLRDYRYLQKLWEEDKAPWRNWSNAK